MSDPKPKCLPLELVAQVFSYLVPEVDFTLNKRDLQSCSLVCKAWRDMSIPYMFSSISFSFAHWPGNPNRQGEQDRLVFESEKAWMTVSTLGTGSTFPCYLPQHRFAVLFNFFSIHPEICNHVRSLQLRALRNTVTPNDGQASAAHWLSRFMGSSPLDKSLFLSTVKLFPRLQRLRVERITLTEVTLHAPRATSILNAETGSPRVPLESLDVDFGRASMFAHHTAGVGHDADLTKIVDCFEGLQELSVSRFIDSTATVFNKAFTPELRLHSLSIKHSGIMGRSLLDFPYIANLRNVQVDVYIMNSHEIHPWDSLFKKMGPRLENLECRINIGANWMTETELPYLSACTNLRTLRLCIVPSHSRAWDMPLHMLTSYLTVADPKLAHMSFIIYDNQFARPIADHIQPLLALGDALLALGRKIVGLEIEVRMHTSVWRDFLLNDLEPFYQLYTRGCVELSDTNFGF